MYRVKWTNPRTGAADQTTVRSWTAADTIRTAWINYDIRINALPFASTRQANPSEIEEIGE